MILKGKFNKICLLEKCSKNGHPSVVSVCAVIIRYVLLSTILQDHATALKQQHLAEEEGNDNNNRQQSTV